MSRDFTLPIFSTKLTLIVTLKYFRKRFRFRWDVRNGSSILFNSAVSLTPREIPSTPWTSPQKCWSSLNLGSNWVSIMITDKIKQWQHFCKTNSLNWREKKLWKFKYIILDSTVSITSRSFLRTRRTSRISDHMCEHTVFQLTKNGPRWVGIMTKQG